MNIHVALVRCCNTLNSSAYPGDLQFFHNAMSSKGIQYEIKGWDDPNVNWKCYSHIILTALIEYDKKIDEFLQWISNIKSILIGSSAELWNPPEVIKWNYNKEYLLELQSNNIRIPKTLLVNESGENLSDWLEGKLDIFKRNEDDVKVVVKSIVSENGTSVWRSNLIKTGKGCYVMQTSDLERLRQQILTSKGKPGVLIQEYLPAILTEGEWSLMYFNKAFSHAVVKNPRQSSHVNSTCKLGDEVIEEEFRVHRHYGGEFHPVQPGNVPDKLLEFGDRILAYISEPLLHARIDIVNNQDGEPCLMEFEILDPDLFLTEEVHGERYLQALLSTNDQPNENWHLKSDIR